VVVQAINKTTEVGGWGSLTPKEGRGCAVTGQEPGKSTEKPEHLRSARRRDW
jgi:hypothetical protein